MQFTEQMQHVNHNAMTHTCAAARKADAVHRGMLSQEVSDFTALAGDEVDQAWREACFMEHL